MSQPPDEPLPLTARIILGIIAVAIVGSLALFLRWDWLLDPVYFWLLLNGIWVTLWLLVTSVVFGLALAIPLGLVQVTGPRPLAWLAAGFCTIIRGTPLLIQLWLVYYGLGSVFASQDWLQKSFLWDPILRHGWPYALAALTLSYAGYEGEVMRGAFAAIPRGELEAGRAFGMSEYRLVISVWLPRAFFQALPTLTGAVAYAPAFAALG